MYSPHVLDVVGFRHAAVSRSTDQAVTFISCPHGNGRGSPDAKARIAMTERSESGSGEAANFIHIT